MSEIINSTSVQYRTVTDIHILKTCKKFVKLTMSLKITSVLEITAVVCEVVCCMEVRLVP